MKDVKGCLFSITLLVGIYFYFHWVFRGAMLVSLHFDAYAPDWLKSSVYFIVSLGLFGVFMVLIGLGVVSLMVHHLVVPIFWAFRIAFDPIRAFVWMTVWSFICGAAYAQSIGFQMIPQEQQGEIMYIWSRTVGILGLFVMVISSLYYEAFNKFKSKSS